MNQALQPSNLDVNGIEPVFKDASCCPDIITIALGALDIAGLHPTAASKFITADGRKESRHPRYFACIQVAARDIEEFKRIYSFVSGSHVLAIINGRFTGEPAYDLRSLMAASFSRELVLRLGFLVVPQAEINTARIGGRNVKARTNELTLPSSWLYDDVDLYDHTPEKYKKLSIEERQSWLANFIPGYKDTPKLITPSSSARVYRAGQPLFQQRWHVWFQHKDANRALITQARGRLRGLMIEAGEAWANPSKWGKNTVHIPMDLGTPWTGGGMVYAGCPEVEKGSTLEVLSAAPLTKILNPEGEPVDLKLVREPNAKARMKAEQALRPGAKVTWSNGQNRSQIDIYDLTPDMDVELEDGSVTTLGELHALLLDRRMAGKK